MNKHLFLLPLCLLAVSCQYSPSGEVKTVPSELQIAEQITVRIEDKNGGNGSGVIVAKEGDTYYVVTAAHVVKNGAAAVVTHSQERIGLSDGEINIVNKDVDVAVVKFKSSQNYRIAEIGKYEFNEQDWVFVSGFPGEDSSKQRHLTTGKVVDRNSTLLTVKDSSEKDGSLSNGNSLVYTNLSLPGMSGGAVLDRKGRVVGINTGAENEQIITQDNENAKSEEINFGYALGIPISTILGVAQGKIPTAQLQVTTTPSSKLSQGEEDELGKAISPTLTKPTQTASEKEWLDYANLLWRVSRDREAIMAFETAIKLIENNSKISSRKEQLRTAYYGLGLTWYANSKMSDPKNQNFQAAAAAFQKASDTDSEFSQSWRYLGKSLKEMKLHDKALIAYETAISKKKDDARLYFEKADILLYLSLYSDAINYYTEAIKLHSNNPLFYNNRGIVYMLEKQHDKAIADFNRAIQANPQWAIAYNNRGFIYGGQRQYDRAIESYSKGIELDPQREKAYYGRGSIYLQKKQYDKATADFDRAIQLNPTTSKAYGLRGAILEEQGKFVAALADFNKAIQLNPQEAINYYHRGVIYTRTGEYNLAMADYDRSIQLDPQYVDAYTNRAFIYLSQKQHVQAIADYNRAIQITPQNAEVYIDRAKAYLKQKQYSQAEADAKKAADLYRAQNNIVAYQQVMTMLEELKTMP